MFSVATFNHKGHKGKTKVDGKKQGTFLPDEPEIFSHLAVIDSLSVNLEKV
jgi:hypothetical protein